jgi:hypothetical protein
MGGTRQSKASKGALLARKKELEAAVRQSRELPAELARIIDNYTCDEMVAESLEPMRAFLREAITASTLTGLESVRKHCRHLAGLARYGLEHGVDLSVAALLTTSMINEYIQASRGTLSEALCAERRSRLLALASNANPGPDTPVKMAPLSHIAVKACYTPAEATAIIRVSQTQPTPAKTRALCAVVGLGLGAGLDSMDLRHLQIGHIVDDGDAGILVHVPGRRARIVPVRRALEPLVRIAIADRPADSLVIGVKKDRNNIASRAVEGAALFGVPHIEQSRLRSTWLADLMTDPIPVGLILKAAGLQSARSLADLIAHVDPWLEHKGYRVDGDPELRGGVA